MATKPLKIALIAGEASGDLLGAGLLRALRERTDDKVEFIGIGGPLMQREGLESYFSQDDLAVRGYTEIIKNLPHILRTRREVTEMIAKSDAKLFIGIDLPDFNFAVERKLHEAGLPIIHYVSPSVWAWKAKRAGKIIHFIDHILCLFPMEAKIYNSLGGRASYVGHPLARAIPLDINFNMSREKLHLDLKKTYIALMPGSRISEIDFMAPVFFETAKLLKQQYPDAIFIIPTATAAGQARIEEIIKRDHVRVPIVFIPAREKHLLLSAANLALVASGTATLEVALCRCPMIISYKISPLTYHLVKPFIHTPHVGLPNILAGKAICPELLQQDATPEKLFTASTTWLNSPERQKVYRNEVGKLHHLLRRDTDELAAEIILDTFKEKIRERRELALDS